MPERVDLQLLRILVRAGRDVERDLGAGSLLGRVVKPVDAADLVERADDAIERENAISIGIRYQQRPRGDEGRNLRIVPAVGVDHVHAGAVPFDAAIDDVIMETGDTGHRYRCFDAVVDRREPYLDDDYYLRDGDYFADEANIFLPLSNDGTRINMILVYTAYRRK